MTNIVFDLPGDEYIALQGDGGVHVINDNIDTGGNPQYEGAIDGITSLLLALAREGLISDDPRWQQAVETAVESVAIMLRSG